MKQSGKAEHVRLRKLSFQFRKISTAFQTLPSELNHATFTFRSRSCQRLNQKKCGCYHAQVQSNSQRRMESASIFERDRYLVLSSLLKEPDLTQFYRHARKKAQSGKMGPGDEQVPGTPCSYGDLMMDGLLNTLLPKIEEASGLSLLPTYSYFRVYKRGDTLAKHVDRPACEISASLCLGFEDVKPWPIWIEAPGGAVSVSLEAGDALLYRGIECPHWREALEGSCQAQVFLHYVNQNGPCAEWKFDKGRSTAGLRSVPEVRLSARPPSSLRGRGTK